MSLSLFEPNAPVLPAGERWRVDQGDAVTWLRGLAAESVDLVVTDPAYESLEKHRAHGSTTRLVADWFPIFPNERFEALMREFHRVLRPNTHCYVLCDQETMFVVKPIAEEVGFKFWKALIWDKRRTGLGYHYRASHEVILFLEKGKRKVADLSVRDVLSVSSVRRVESCKCLAKTPKDTSRSTSATEGSGLSTTSSGSATTGQSHRGSRFTTGTRTRPTIASRTSNSSTGSPTRESTPDANSGMESGGSPAPSAENSSHSTPYTGTSAPTDDRQSSGDAGAATSALSSTGSEPNDSRCVNCGMLASSKPFPTEKPVELLEILVRQSSSPGELVIDPFVGSGSTGEAALRLDRRFAGCDLTDRAAELTRARLRGLA